MVVVDDDMVSSSSLIIRIYFILQVIIFSFPFMSGSCAEFHWTEIHDAFETVLKNGSSFLSRGQDNDILEILNNMQRGNLA